MESTIIQNGTRGNMSSTNITTDLDTLSCGFNNLYHCATFVLCSIIVVAGCIGNLLTVCILTAKERFRKQTTFICINFLAVSDLISLSLTYYSDMFSSSDDFDLGAFSDFECILFMVVGLTPFLVSLYALALLALVRYHVISYPLSVSRLKSRRFIIIVYGTGIVALSSAMAVMGRVSLDSMTCYDALNNNGNLAFTHPPAILGTIALLLVLHALKVKRLRSSISARTYNMKASIRRINIVIYIVMGLFIVCQMPYIIHDVLNLLHVYVMNVMTDLITKTLHNVGIVFYLLNHSVNPYIYFISFYFSQKQDQASGSNSKTKTDEECDTDTVSNEGKTVVKRTDRF